MSTEALWDEAIGYLRKLMQSGCETEGNCHYCGVRVELEPHWHNCSWVAARAFLDRIGEPAKEEGDDMKILPRYNIVQDATHEISGLMLDLVKKHGLSYVERMSILTALMTDTIKFALRAERHPDEPDKPADVE